ncbi:MAG: NifB/NifX family molybdenum-iron cluster-binding protein [Candidatus Glassbacteria bacterium]|nr:NifB/NifX family molybdenum-iron cluster-binding protein [Candidatus Glassbacteria bacterium]
MKIVISSQGKELDSQVDPRFGRGSWFIVVDTESGAFQAVDNTPNLNLAQGAGIQAAETVSRLGAEAVMTGNCGPKAFRTLSAAGIKVFSGIEGTVREAVERFKAGALTASESHDVEGHWS